MLYAYVGEQKREPEPGLLGVCPGCSGEVISKCGKLVTWHWAHRAGRECDPWSEPIGPWHLSWQSIIRPESVEVPIGPHRADVVGNRGTIVELQHSPISTDEIEEREQFYGNMVWLFDATTRFDLVACGTVSFFSWGTTKHIEACRKPAFLDFGDSIVRIDRLTGRWFKGISGYGVHGDRRWFIDQFLSDQLINRRDIGSAIRRTASNSRLEAGKHFELTDRDLLWINKDNGTRVITNAGAICIPVKYYNILEKCPEIANGWTTETMRLCGTFWAKFGVVEGLVRVIPITPNFSSRTTSYLGEMPVSVLREHVRQGRMPIFPDDILDEAHAEKPSESQPRTSQGRLF